MSSVSPTYDGNLAEYYRKALRDAAHEVRDESRRHEQQRNEEIDRLEKGYSLDLQKKNEDMERTTKDVRDEANKNYTKQKEKYENTIDDIRREEYNKFGFDKSEGVKKYYEQAIDDLRNQLESEKRRHWDAEKAEENKSKDAIQTEILKREGESDRTIKALHEANAENLTRSKEEMRGEVEEAKHRLYNSKGQVPGAISPEVHKYQIEGLNQALERERENSVKNFNAREADYNQLLKDVERRGENRISQVTEDNERTSRDLTRQLKELSGFNAKQNKEKSDVNATLVQDHREEQKADLRKIENDYNQRVDKYKKAADAKDDYIQENSEKLLRDKEAYFTDIIRKQNEINGQNLDRLQKSMSSQIVDLERQEKESKERANQSYSDNLTVANQERKKALENQAKIFKENFDRQRVSDNSDITALQKELSERRSPVGAKNIPAAAEEGIRKSVIREYEKVLGTEVENNKQRTEETQRKFGAQHQETVNDFHDQQARAARQNAIDRAYEKSEFLDSMTETEYNAKTQVRTEREHNDRERESTRRGFETFVDRQRRQYDFIIENDRAEAATRLNEVRQQAIADFKNLHREMALHQSEIIREYDSKLESQKATYEAQIDAMKMDAVLNQHDLERKAKQDLEFQAKDYEQRISQQDVQNKERERYIVQNYEDQIEKIKRGYELSKKKS